MSTTAPFAFLRQGRGEPLVLLHGFASSSGFWAPTIAALASRYDVIAPDWPGFGAAQDVPPCADLRQFATHLLTLLETLGVSRCHFMGFSMSGFVVQHLMQHHPERVRSVILYGAGTHLDMARRFEPLDTTIARLRDEGVAATIERVLPAWLALGAASPHLATCREAARGMTVEAGIAAMRAMATADFRGKLGTYAGPALVIAGDRDHTHPPASALALWRELPQAQLAILPGCGHAAHWEQPDWFHHMVSAFLDDRHPPGWPVAPS